MDPEPLKQLAVENGLSAGRPTDTRRPLPEIVFGDSLQNKEIILPDEIIKGMLHKGAKMMLGGGSKSFKTWCLADLAMSIAGGVPWWGREVKQGRVLYLNLEVQAPFFEKRLQEIARVKGILIPAELGIWNLRGHCVPHFELLPRLAERLRGDAYTTIILDPVYKVASGPENAAEEVAALMNSIERMTVETDAACVFGAHFAKGTASQKEAIDRVAGSGVFARDPDAILTMTKHAEPDTFVIDSILRNCPPIPPFCVRWEHPLMKAVYDLDPDNLKLAPGSKPERKPKEASELLALIPKEGAISKTTLKSLAAASGFTARGTDGAIEMLKFDRKIHEFYARTGGKAYLTQGDPDLIDKSGL